MSHLHDGDTLVVQLLEQFHDLLALTGMQIASRLVRQDQLRTGDHGARDANELLLAARQLVWKEIFFGDHVEAVQSIANNALTLGLFEIAIGERNFQVLVDRERVEQIVALEDEADVSFIEFGAVFFVQAVNRMLEEEVFAGPGGVVHSEKVKQGGLPCPGRPHDGDELTFFDVDVDSPQNIRLGGACFITLLDVSEGDHCAIRILGQDLNRNLGQACGYVILNLLSDRQKR